MCSKLHPSQQNGSTLVGQFMARKEAKNTPSPKRAGLKPGCQPHGNCNTALRARIVP